MLFYWFVVRCTKKGIPINPSDFKDYRFLKAQLLYNSRKYLALRARLVQYRSSKRTRNRRYGGVYRVPPADYVQNLQHWLHRFARMEVHRSFLAISGAIGIYWADRIILQAAKENWCSLDPQNGRSGSEGNIFFRDRGHATQGNDLIAQWVLIEEKLIGNK